MAVVSPAALAACASGSSESGVTTTEPAVQPTAERVTEPTTPTTGPAVQPTAAPATDPTTAPTSGSELEPVTWARANLGFVSAYVLARGNTAAIVDTGVAGSAIAIGETLTSLGLTYNDVAHVILTHNHGDHAGSITDVLELAVNATAYAGEADLGPLPADLSGLRGGEDIFGFEMLATPGHTAGHMAVIDHQAGLLVAGDAIFSEGGAVVEGPERFFADVPESRESIKAMAALTFNTLLVGHGEPIEDGADAAVAALAATL